MNFFETSNSEYNPTVLLNSEFRKQLLDDAISKKTQHRIFRTEGENFVYSVQADWIIPEIESIFGITGIKRILYFVVAGQIQGSIHQDANLLNGRHTQESYILPIENCDGMLMSWWRPTGDIEYFEGAEKPSKVPRIKPEHAEKIAETSLAKPLRVDVFQFHSVKNTQNNVADFLSIRFE